MHYTTHRLRTQWFEFWESKGHTIIPSASVIPDNDPTALFHNSGMHPLVPYLMGESHPAGKRLADVQKCIRTIDIDEVGDATHLTFFEMLGNWSLGDFFKSEQIPWSFEFLTEVLELPLERLAFSVFEGDQDAPRDEEAAQLWRSVGVSNDRIAYLPKSENWWTKGETGPCGPDSEIFYWTGKESAPKNYQETWEDERWVEIWNNVFMQFNKDQSGTLKPLPNQNIDTGMGLERTVAVLNGFTSVYQTDAFTGILEHISALSDYPDLYQDPIGTKDEHNSMRIIADHIRSGVIMISDGIEPSNVERGYILRRLLRRAIRHGRKIGIDNNLCKNIAKVVIEHLESVYPSLSAKAESIFSVLEKEEAQFRNTLVKGEKEFQKRLEGLKSKNQKVVDGETAFDLYQTYGFPIEITQELAGEHDLKVDTEGFTKAQKNHQQKSREGAAGRFAGGLSGEDLEAEKKLHTATHLMNAALKKFVGPHTYQKGAHINSQRLRFDFAHEVKLDEAMVETIENYVNEAIAADVEIGYTEMSVEEAKAKGAIGVFTDKYGERVKVYEMGDYSLEICGGPHSDRTGELGTFKIKKQESVGKGVRRIKAVLL